jgi:hypothetical protein
MHYDELFGYQQLASNSRRQYWLIEQQTFILSLFYSQPSLHIHVDVFKQEFEGKLSAYVW